MPTVTLERTGEATTIVDRPAEATAEARSSGGRSTWRYLPHALLVTFGTVVAPIVSVGLIQSLTGDRSILLTLVLAASASAAIASAGSWLWQRRPNSRDILFGDLMLWCWLRRLRTERRLAQATKLLDGRALVGAAADRDRQIEVLEQLARALDARDPYTHGHSQRVARSAHMIASRMGLPAEQAAKIRVAAAVHDAGKLNTDRTILNKPGALTDDEFAVIKRHPGDGADLLEPLGDPEIVAMVRYHHERLDGSGYPEGLEGGEIPIGARIIAVVDTFDAITSTRPYRRPRRQHAALKVLKQEAGTRLDAQAVGVFLTYYTGRRTAAWSSLAVAVPERLLAILTGGAGPLAQGAAATVAAASVGGALVTPALDTTPSVSAKTAAVQQAGSKSGSRANALPPGLGVADARKRAERRGERRARRQAAGASSGRTPGGADQQTGRPTDSGPSESATGVSGGGNGSGGGGNGSGGGGNGSGGGSAGEKPAKSAPEQAGGTPSGDRPAASPPSSPGNSGQGQSQGNGGGSSNAGGGQGQGGGSANSGGGQGSANAQSQGSAGGSGNSPK